MKKFFATLTAIAALTGIAFGELQETEYHGDIQYVVAEESATNFEAEAARTILIGFETEPIVLDVTDEAAPRLLVNYDVMESEGTYGAYVACETGTQAAAFSANNIIDIEAIVLK